MGKARNFSESCQKKVSDAHSHDLTTLKMCSPTVLECPQTQTESKIFSCDTQGEEIASRSTMGWIVTEAAELGHVLYNL